MSAVPPSPIVEMRWDEVIGWMVRLTAEADVDVTLNGSALVPWKPEVDRLAAPTKEYDHDPRPDDMPEPGDRCKDCGEDITWMPGTESLTDEGYTVEWLHVDDVRNRPETKED